VNLPARPAASTIVAIALIDMLMIMVKWMKVIVFLKRIDRLKKVKIKRHRRINDSKKVDWQTVKVAEELKWD
jgi:hypothetical protein